MIVGIDLGGSTARCLVTTETGSVHGRSKVAGSNPTSAGVRPVIKGAVSALRMGLAGADPATVSAIVIGAAGLEDHPMLAQNLCAAIGAVGVTVEPILVADAVIAMASGEPTGTGSLLVAGTGAVGVHLVNHAIRRVADGRGWLLGDDGGGFWLGRSAVQTALDDVESGIELSGMKEAVLLACYETPKDRHAVLTAIYAAPRQLSQLASIVLDYVVQGDPAAQLLAESACQHLLSTLQRVRAPDSTDSVVLVGGVASHPAMKKLLASRIATHWPHAAPLWVPDGTIGAVWLGLNQLGITDTGLHERLVASTTSILGSTTSGR